MTAYCLSAISGLAVLRTWLYSARFGPTETSYQDMNQNPGILIFMLSWNKPPLYHAGSFGVRWIICPPVSTGILSAKIPRGPSIATKMSFTGKCRNAFDQSTVVDCGAWSNHFEARIRSSCEVFAGNIGLT